MVTSVTNLGRSGPFDWMVQRVSAVILGTYAIWLAGVLLFMPAEYAAWKDLFSGTAVRIFSLLAVLSLGAHAWVGLWIITTDYLKHSLLRFLVQAACGLVMFIYVMWAIQILWGL